MAALSSADDGERAQVHRRQVVHDAVLERRTQVRRGGQLPLGQAVTAVVLDDVDDGDVAPHQVRELAGTDGARVAVAADPDGHQVLVGQDRARGHGWHAPVHRIEAVGGAQKVRRALAGAADARQLDDTRGVHAHLEERFHDPLGDGVVAASRAQGGLPAPVRGGFEIDAVDFPAGSRRGGRFRGHGHPFTVSDSCASTSSLIVRASIGRPA
jgi:hypothetical protein